MYALAYVCDCTVSTGKAEHVSVTARHVRHHHQLERKRHEATDKLAHLAQQVAEH